MRLSRSSVKNSAAENPVFADKRSANTGKGKKRRKRNAMWKSSLVVLFMMAPGLIYLFINNYMPLIGLTLAFKNPDMSLRNIFASPWCGFENFALLFESDMIWLYVRNTVLYNVAFIAINMIIPVFMAILFVFVKGKIKNVYQTVILLPYLMSWVIVSYVSFALFGGENGMINSIIEATGGKKINFYGAEAIGAWPFIITFFYMWKSTGFTFLFYYSSIIAISASLYEAAKLDGANFWQQVWHVTLPGIKSVMMVMLIMGVAGIFRSDYGLFYLVTQNSGQLYPVTQTIDTYIFNALKGSGDIVTSSAAGILQSLVGFVLVVSANVVIKKVDPDNALF